MLYKFFSLKYSGCKYEHKKVNKKYFFTLNVNYFLRKLRAKSEKF